MNSLEQIIAHIHNFAPGAQVTVNVDPQRQQFGDLSTNAALILAKQQGKNPRVVAQEIVDKLAHPGIKSLDIAGPGFINITLAPQVYQNLLHELSTQKDSFFKAEPTTPFNHANIEYVSANPTGPLHLGHGRGGIIGDVLASVMTFIGQPVTKEFYINDAGKQITTLGLSFKARCLQELGHDAPVPEDGYQGLYLQELATKVIAEFGKEVEHKPDSFFQEYAKSYLLTQIKQTLSEYGVDFDVWFSEKTLHDSGAIAHCVERLQASGAVYEKDGALWLASTRYGDDKDRVVRRQNGELTYVAADIAYLENKLNRGAQKLILILGQDHHSYVWRLKAALQALGHQEDQLDVILYQLVTIKESGELVRLSKRAGRIVGLQDVVHEVGKDGARFFYLHRKADAHLDFDLSLALKHTDENPVYYIQYAYVRTLSILEKAREQGITFGPEDAQQVTEHEYVLLKKIVTLKQLLLDITHHYQTHMLTYYLVELAQLFHHYYAHTKVLDAANLPTTRARLLVVKELTDTFNLCLRLLGISTPDKM